MIAFGLDVSSRGREIGDGEFDRILVVVVGGALGLTAALVIPRIPAVAAFWHADLIPLLIWVFAASIVVFGIRRVVRDYLIWLFLLTCFPPNYLLMGQVLGGTTVAFGRVVRGDRPRRDVHVAASAPAGRPRNRGAVRRRRRGAGCGTPRHPTNSRYAVGDPWRSASNSAAMAGANASMPAPIVDAYRAPIDISRGAVRVARHVRRAAPCAGAEAASASTSADGGDAGTTESRTVIEILPRTAPEQWAPAPDAASVPTLRASPGNRIAN